MARVFTCLLLNLILALAVAGTSLADETITVTEQGTGSGKVTAPGINCTSGSLFFCDAAYPIGTTVTITATAAPGSVFAGWDGACYGVSGDQCTLVVNGLKNVTASFNSVGAPPVLLAGAESGSGVSINSLGEAVWSKYDEASNNFQVFSSQRGMLTNDAPSHHYPAVNSLGDVVWIESDNYSPPYSVRGIIAGSAVTITTSSDTMITKVDINDHREVVWSKDDGNVSHIYSSTRGQLTNDERLSSFNPSLNNNGDVAFLLNDRETQGPAQVYLLSAGSTTPVALTGDALQRFDVSINDLGEVVWSEYDEVAFDSRAVSNLRGVLWTYMQIVGVDINNCGDLVYAPYTFSGGEIYRLGSNSPCGVTGTEDGGDQTPPVAEGAIFPAAAHAQAPLSAGTAAKRRPVLPSRSPLTATPPFSATSSSAVGKAGVKSP